MLIQKTRLVSSLVGAALAAGVAISYYSAEAQDPASDHQAVTDTVNQHVHSMVVTDGHLKELIKSTGDNDTVTLSTSQEFNGNPKDGGLHSHQVKLDKLQMQVLDATGTIDVETEEAAGHKHIMRYYKPKDCPTTYPKPQSYPPQSCPYGGKCKYPQPYPTYCQTCQAPCTTCKYPYPYPTTCPTCPAPRPCQTCTPLPPTTYTSPVPTGKVLPPGALPSILPSTPASVTPSAVPSAPCTPGLDCDCVNSPKDPHGGSGISNQCGALCTTPGSACFCQLKPRDPICPAGKAGCAPTDLACICGAQPWALECRCYVDPTGPDCFVPSSCAPYTQCYCGGNPRAPGCAEFLAGLPSPVPSGTVSPGPSASPLAIVGGSPGVTGSPSASPTPSETPSPSPSPTPTSTCDIPGTDCYCGIQGPTDPNCTVSCSTPGTSCYCAFTNPQDPVCTLGGGATRGTSTPAPTGGVAAMRSRSP